MFVFNEDIQSTGVIDGVTRKVLAYSEKLMLCELTLKKGTVIAEHAHPHEQCTYIISGKLRITVGDDIAEISSGDSALVPGNLTHGVTVLEDTAVLDIFSPMREDFV